MKRDRMTRKIERLNTRLMKKEDEAAEQELLSLQEQLRNMPVLHKPRFFSNDCTSEALTSLLAANGGIFSVISTEGGIIDIVKGRYSGSVNIDTWLQAHSSDTICVDRKGREPEYIENPALTTILTVQASVLMDILTNPVLCGRGFAARFLYAFPVSMLGNRIFRTPPILETVKQAYHDLVYRLMDIPRKESPTMLTLSDEAAGAFDELHCKTERFLAGEGQSIIEWAAKYCGAVLRIAGLLHVAEHEGDVVDAETVKRAICIGEFFLAHAQFAFTQLVADETISKAKVVVAKLKAAKQPYLKRSEVFRMCRSRYFKKTEDIFPTLELLENNGYIRQFLPDPCSAPGRKPDVLVYVNPQLLSEE